MNYKPHIIFKDGFWWVLRSRSSNRGYRGLTIREAWKKHDTVGGLRP